MQTASDRGKACMAEVRAVLEKHGCRIVTTIRPSPVGEDGQRVLLESAWGVLPKPEQNPGEE
jgi:isochorismate hydrolase